MLYAIKTRLLLLMAILSGDPIREADRRLEKDLSVFKQAERSLEKTLKKTADQSESLTQQAESLRRKADETDQRKAVLEGRRKKVIDKVVKVRTITQ